MDTAPALVGHVRHPRGFVQITHIGAAPTTGLPADQTVTRASGFVMRHGSPTISRSAWPTARPRRAH